MNRKNIDLRPRRSLTSNLARALCLLALTALVTHNTCAVANQQQPDWNVGIASVAITPDKPMWMAGYAARTKPSEGKTHDLYAKALALLDAQDARLVILTLDLIGVNRQMRDWLEKEVKKRYQLTPQELLICASHTHSGPVLHKSTESIYGNSFYGLNPEQIKQCRNYSENLRQKLVHLIGQALEKPAPARLTYTHARAGFAMNRRSKRERGYNISPNPDGPVDHDVPVLRIDAPDGKLRAVVFGYACHNTTLSLYKFCGDYSGFAQQYIEQAHPEATSFFIAGCGGDQNPYPRRTLELAQQHGRALANAVETALTIRTPPIRGPIHAALDTVTLDFAEPPAREQLDQQAKSANKYERRHAQVLLNELERNGKIRTTYPYPVHVVQFGNDLTLVALAGEVVVDYSLRLKAELKDRTLWVAAYSNDVFGYIPSLRVLNEGGYEAGGAMRYTELPGPFAPSVETLVINKVHELVKKVGAPKSK